MKNNGRLVALCAAFAMVGCASSRSEKQRTVEVRRAIAVPVERAIAVERKKPSKVAANIKTAKSQSDVTESVYIAPPTGVRIESEASVVVSMPPMEDALKLPEGIEPYSAEMLTHVYGSITAIQWRQMDLESHVEALQIRLVEIMKINRELERVLRDVRDQMEVDNIRNTIGTFTILLTLSILLFALVMFDNRHRTGMARLESIIGDQSAQIARLRPFAPVAAMSAPPIVETAEKKTTRKRAPRVKVKELPKISQKESEK